MEKARISIFDLMRCVALIVIVLLHHMPSYLGNFYRLDVNGAEIDLSFLSHMFRYLGLGLFTFMSGYLLSIKNTKITNITDVSAFMSKRLVKIYPLYWVALIVYLFMFCVFANLPMTWFNFSLHVFGLQLFYDSPLPTLWYVGLIVPYYFFFLLLSLFDRKKWEGVALVIFIGLITIESVFPKIDNRLILYWPIFFLGMRLSGSSLTVSRWIVGLSVVGFVLGSVGYLTSFSAPEDKGASAAFFVASMLLWIVMASFVFLVHFLCQICRADRIHRMAYLLAYSSFAVYLFHRPVYELCRQLLFLLGLYDNVFFRSLAFAFATVALVVFSYSITYGIDRIEVSIRQWGCLRHDDRGGHA